MPRNSKRNADICSRFLALIRESLDRHGAVKSDGLHPYTLDTPIGTLGIHPSANPSLDGRDVFLTVYTRWPSPEQAYAAGFNCNRHTGKDNHHYDGALCTPEAAAADFARWLERAKAGSRYPERPQFSREFANLIPSGTVFGPNGQSPE